MFDWLRTLATRWLGAKRPTSARLRAETRDERRARFLPRSRYDAAATNDDNRKHWANADGLSAKATNNLGVRRLLRNRSRYERDNNGYCGGLVTKLANDMIGTGPRLQAQLPDADELNKSIEQKFAQWWDAVGLTQKLLTSKMAKTGDGETVMLLVRDDVPGEEVQLDVILLECDQLTTPVNALPTDLTTWVDGIEFDLRGRPLWYHILETHPGDNFNVAILYALYKRLPASQVIHWFRPTRPGQARGVPEITAGLPLCAQLRRWTLATLTAAETAADIAILLTTENAGDAETVNPTPFETMEIDRGLMTSLPAGTDAKQMVSEHPNQQFSGFKGEVLNELGAPVHAPKNIVTGSSAEYNYSSARMDYLLYRSALLVERDSCRREVLDRVLGAWYEEARLIPGYLAPVGVMLPERLPHAWYWPGFAAIDPLKEALADTERLTNCTTTLQELLAESGQDWEVFLRQRARERNLMIELGLPVPSWMDAAAGKTLAAGSAGQGAIDGATGAKAPLSRRQIIDMALAEDKRTNGAYLNGNGAH